MYIHTHDTYIYTYIKLKIDLKNLRNECRIQAGCYFDNGKLREWNKEHIGKKAKILRIF